MPLLADRVDFVLGVDTHKRTHTAAVVTSAGGVLALWAGSTSRVPRRRMVGDAYVVLDFLLLVLATPRAGGRRRCELVLENLLLRHQLTVLTRPTRRRRMAFRRLDKALWVLVRRLRRDWRRRLVVVTPDTVIRWHRAGRRLSWRWRSRGGGGRLRLSADVRDQIVRVSAENPLWGSERIRGELLKLGIAASDRTPDHTGGLCPPGPSTATAHLAGT